jgi:uncharacterized protein (TIGR02145 family)
MKQLLLIMMTCGAVGAWAQNRPKVAVLEFQAGAGISPSETEGIASALHLALFDSDAFELTERSQVEKAIEELGFSKAEMTDEQVMRLGSSLAVKQIVKGEINRSLNEYRIDIRLFDVKQGLVTSLPDMVVGQGSLLNSIPRMSEQLIHRMSLVRTPPAGASASAGSEVVTLHGYLQVFPEDLGEFSARPAGIISNVNQSHPYGYNSWRIPRMEELELIRSSSNRIGGLTSGWYWSSDKGALNFKTGAKTTAPGSYRVRLITTGATAAAVLQDETMLNSLGPPPHAASKKKWFIQGNGITQIWSDAIEVPACNKLTFEGTSADCRNNPGYRGYLYSWLYVSNNAAMLCPAPWKVPAREDFIALDQALRNADGSGSDAEHAAKYISVWGGIYGGFVGTTIDRVYEIGSYADYWSSTVQEDGTNVYRLSVRKTGYVNPQDIRDKRYGLQVRCVYDN